MITVKERQVLEMAEKQDITKITKQILASPAPGTYALFGGEEFLKRHFLSDLKKKVIPDDMAELNYSVFSGPDSADEVLETAYTLPQFSDARMIVWYNSGFPSPPARYKKAVEDVLARAAGFPYLYFVLYLSEDELSASSREDMKALEKLGGNKLFFDFLPPQRLIKWIQRHFEAEGLTISEQNAQILCERCGGNMNVLSNQIDKLCVFARENGKSEITVSETEAIVAADAEFSAFFISDCLRKRDIRGLTAYIDDAEKRAEKPQLIMANVVSEAEKLCRIKFAQRSGIPQAQIAKTLGLNEYVVKLALPAVSKITEGELCRFLHACYEADRSIKSTGSDPYGTLRQLVCSL